MHQSTSIKEVLPNVAFDMNFILSHMTDLSEHKAAILFPCHILREGHCDLPKNGIGVCRHLTVIYAVKHHKFVPISELAGKHALEKLFDLAHFTGRDTLQVLKDTNERWHALAANKVQGSIPNLIDCFRMLKWVLLQATNICMFAAHYGNHYICNLAHIKH